MMERKICFSEKEHFLKLLRTNDTEDETLKTLSTGKQKTANIVPTLNL